ncbi:MAG TPA: RNA methyltransferase [Anaerolineaceae bacterium]|nr:RNA methyltransferase [Anaerolineaceae bacterium]
MITSSANEHIKTLRKLDQAKERRSSGNFLAEGLKAVGQAFDSGAKIQELIVSPELLISEYGRTLIERANKQKTPVLELSSSVFATLARKEKPQGIAALIAQNWEDISTISAQPDSFWVAIESIQNPGNLGTILRTCDAVGASGLILLDDSTDPYDPAAVKASMGSIFTVPHFRAGFNDFEAFLERSKGLKVIGTSDKAESSAFEVTFPPTNLLLLGSERQGLSEKYVSLCSQMLRIPMEGACDSLNISVAAGVILYQIYQHRQKEQRSL